MHPKEKTFTTETVKFILSIKPKTIALSGGSTPGPIYKKLANILGKNIPRDRNFAPAKFPCSLQPPQNGNSASQNFFQVDERYVPRTDKNSNYKLITDCGLKLSHFFDTSLPIDETLKKYEVKLPAKFDLIILGIGEDGHIASIFPEKSTKSTSLLPAIPSQKVVHTFAPKTSPIKDRLTLTLPYILKAKNILVLLKNKPQILKILQNQSKTGKPATQKAISKFPALALLNHKNLTIHSI
ncbi:6-phosphogluconolactonase [Candidatus Peregrinibacteria bacterium]|nr:6-phosphogluconolactonase [Candidatus Peregrinibacteria bacterium]